MLKKQGETKYQKTSFGIISYSKLILLEIEGIKKVWDFILQKRKIKKLPLTPAFFKKIHQIGFAWFLPKISGTFRKVEVKVSNHQPPKFFEIPQIFSEFCKDLKTREKFLPKIEESNFIEELIEFLAWAHHRFLWIHPFIDYNGRIGRILINIILLNLDLPPIELKVETEKGREKYIKALQQADNNNYKDLKKIIESALKESLLEFK